MSIWLLGGFISYQCFREHRWCDMLLNVSGCTEGCEQLSKQVAHFSQPVPGSLGEVCILTWPQWGAFTSLVLGACRSVKFMFIQLTLKKMGRRGIAVWHLLCRYICSSFASQWEFILQGRRHPRMMN